MKTLLLGVLFIFSMNLSAKESCVLYQLVGKVKIADTDLKLVLAKGTLSEVSLIIPREIQGQAAPYINHLVLTQIILNKSSIDSQAQVKKIVFIESTVPDSLAQGPETTRKKIKEVKCPKDP